MSPHRSRPGLHRARRADRAGERTRPTFPELLTLLFAASLGCQSPEKGPASDAQLERGKPANDVAVPLANRSTASSSAPTPAATHTRPTSGHAKGDERGESKDARDTVASAGCVTPASLGAAPLDPARLSGVERAAVLAARAELERVLERPADFRATIDASPPLVVLELWHATSLHACVDGPTADERNRSFVYDVRKGHIVSTRWKRGAPRP